MFSHIRSWQQSGMSQKDYYTRHGIKPWTFYYWLDKYRQKQEAPPAEFIPIHTGNLQSEAIRISYPNGVVLHLPAQTGLPSIQALIKMM